jgi:L-lactate utilization protein LutB
MLPAFILEPSPDLKRRAFGQALVEPKVRPFAGLVELKAQLRQRREAAIADLESLSIQLVESLGRLPEVNVVRADDEQQAIEAIRQACGTTETIAFNHSSIVTQELAPGLGKSGFRIVDSYYEEFPSFDDRFIEYHELPRDLADYLVASFNVSNLADFRNSAIEESEARDFVGLMGVNAISASDGTVFFLQQFHNISRVFQQARKLVLVVGLDKIAIGPEEARLQALGTGIFGWEARLLGMGAQRGKTGTESISLLPSSNSDPDLLIILMDNGRSRLLNSPYQDVLTCIGCRACIKSCPTQQFFGANTGWSPKEYLYFFVQNRNPSLDLCIGCGMCRIECPLDIGLPEMIIRARLQKASRASLGRRLLGNIEFVSRSGSRIPALANLALGHRLSRWFAERTLGISRDAPVPGFHGDTLKRWLETRDGHPDE